MSKHDMLKAQTCVLRVNIHCEGCMHKVKKKLQKVDGVYKVNIDSEQGRVIVSGNADPASLIEKLEKAGKHAELWGGPQKPVPVFITNDQLKKFQMEKNGKNKGNHEHKNGNGFPQTHHEKGFKDDKLFSAKDQKSVRFNLPEDDEFDDDEFYEDDDEFDDDEEFYDESDDEFGEGGFDGHKPPAKAAAANGVGHKAAPNGDHKGEKEGKPKKGGGGGGGGGLDVFLKGMFRKAGGRKKGDSDKKSKKKDDNGRHGGKKGGFELGDLKKGKNDDGRSKKGGEGFDGGKHQHQQQQQQHHQQQQQQQMFNEMMKTNHKGGGGGGGGGGGAGGGGGGGRNMDHMMGQKGSFPAVAGMPAMNGFIPGPVNNPYSQQQQYMAQMLMMNQKRENGHGAYHPSGYAGPPQPAMSYGPPPGMMYGAPPPMSYGAPTEPYTNMFSDENTDSCSIM